MSPSPTWAQRYGLALLLLLASMVFVMAVPEGEWERVVAMVLQGAALLATLAAAEADSRLFKLFVVAMLIAIVFAVTQAIVGENPGPGFAWGASLVVLLAFIPAIVHGVVRQARSERRITVHTMLGVLCLYLLMTIIFAYSFAMIGEISGTPFFNQGAEWNQIGDFLYYSLITITTVGMGDLTPATNLGRSLTAAEALIGQIYMVTVVALIVANLGHSRKSESGTS